MRKEKTKSQNKEIVTVKKKIFFSELSHKPCDLTNHFQKKIMNKLERNIKNIRLDKNEI